jgi:hypothetical protein
MLGTILTANDVGTSSGNLILEGEVYVVVSIIDIITLRDGSETTSRKEDIRKYNLNDPYEYGALIEDSLLGFVEERAAGGPISQMTAWQELRDPNTTPARKQQILESGKPYKYANTKFLASVRVENNKFYLINQNKPSIYAYNYDDKCEKLDFDSKVYPGTNKLNPNSPCYDVQVTPEETGSVPVNIELSLLNSSFIDFDDYRNGYKSLFQEVGFRSGSVGSFLPFSPKQFQFISQSLIVDEYENVVIGPVRVTEEEVEERGAIRTDLVVFQAVQQRNRRTGAIRSGSGLEVEVYRTTLSEIPGDIFIYKKIEGFNVRSTILYNNTLGVWNGNGKLYNFYTSSVQTNTEKSYKLDVLSGSCDINKMFSIYYGDSNGHGTVKLSEDRKQYGYSKSVYSMISSMVGNTLTKKLFFTDNSVSQSSYLLNQLATLSGSSISSFVNSNFTLAYDPSGYGYVDFVDNLDSIQISGSSDFYLKPGLNATAGPVQLKPVKTAEKIFAIQINPKLLKNSIDEGNFELCLAKLSGSSIQVDNNSDKVIQLIDSSREYDIILEGDRQDSNRFKSGFVGQLAYDLVSGSLVNGIHSNANPIIYGKVYPGYGLIVLDAEKLNTELNLGIVSQSNYDGMNPLRLFTSISGSANPTSVRDAIFPFNARKVDASIVETIQVLLNGNEFNYSTNPSYYANRERSPFFREANRTNFANGRLTDGTLRFRQWFYDPITYITAIGLYNDDYELLAIGKLSKPIKKSFKDTLKLKVNIRY